MNHLHVFVITGGPCAGKTTGLSVVEQLLTKHDYKVIVVAETATELITSGLSPDCIPHTEFQRLVLDRSLNKEQTTSKAINHINGDVIVLYDRGILDSKAYMSDEDFKELLDAYGLSETIVRDNYDAVFHLVTAADGAEEFYTLENNLARSETPEQARALDKKTRDAWVGHPHLRIIDNNCSFEAKIKKLCDEIMSAVGIPVPIERERKFLIKKPSYELLESIHAVKRNIIQTYLHSEDKSVERRVRQRGINGEFSYYYTEKRAYSNLGRIETEKKISEKEYLSLLLQVDKVIRKDRYFFPYKSQYFELDIYPAWSEDWAILEIELMHEDQEIELPKWVEVIKEVTEDSNYRNYNLAVKQ